MHALVTGPGGFLGRYVVEQLVARGDRVRGLCRRDYPELRAIGVNLVRGDLANRPAVEEAVKGVDCVFHIAGKVGVWGRWDDYWASNVEGTLNVISGCQRHGVERLVFTSSPSVTFAGEDQEGINETALYPETWLAYYPQTKAIAEEAVLEANGLPVEGGAPLRACSLRPHLVWGPRDHHLTARLVERARAGKLRRVGDGANLVDIIYVENAAEAHLLAADALAPVDSPAAGRSYFLSQGEPVNCWEWIDQVLALADLPPVKRRVSARAAFAIGAAMEAAYWATRRTKEPQMTRFLARQLSTSHWFDISAARRDLGYQPRVSTEEGMRRLREWLQQQRAAD